MCVGVCAFDVFHVYRYCLAGYRCVAPPTLHQEMAEGWNVQEQRDTKTGRQEDRREKRNVFLLLINSQSC